jgi:hypothetical protein
MNPAYLELRGGFDIAERKFSSLVPAVVQTLKLTEAEEIAINFQYPLSAPVTRSFTHPGGFSVTDFCQAVADGYEAIYAEEEASRSPGFLEGSPLFYNRRITDGVHGIWGHALSDLVIEWIEPPRALNGVWEIGIGS